MSRGNTSLFNCTLSGNTATRQAALYNLFGTMFLDSCTIAGNSGVAATKNGGFLVSGNGAATTRTEIGNTIISGNTVSDIDSAGGGTFVSDGYNLVGSGNLLNGFNRSTDNRSGANAGLALLAENGGPTPTRALLAGSPALDTGSTSLSGDQRGVSRPQGSAADKGAFEFVPLPTISSFTPSRGPVGTSVVITGTNFTGVTGVTFNGTSATSYTVDSATQITVTVPTGATTGTISVTTQGGSATSASNFTVEGDGVTSGVLISQFRLSGPGGNSDEFIELANTSAASLNLTGLLLQAGGAALPGLSLSGKSIPAGGRFLVTNSMGYSLGAYAAGDITYASDIALGSTLSLVSGNTVVDSVGDLSLIASPTSATSNYAYLRRLDGGAPRDTDADASDFTLVDVGSTGGGTATGLSTLSMGVRLGAPGPHNLSSPIQRNALIASTPLNPGAGFNPVARYGSRGNTSVDTQGRLSLRRNIKNNTGATVTRMRFRLVALTSGTSTSGVSDLRAISSAGVMFGGNQVAQGVTLEAPSSPTTSPLPTSGTGNGGGLNSSWTVALSGGTLAPGASIGVEFLFGIQQEGSYRIVIDTELLP